MNVLFDARAMFGKFGGGIPEYTKLLLFHMLQLGFGKECVLFLNSFFKRSPYPDFVKEIPSIDWGIPNRGIELSSLLFHFPLMGFFRKYDVLFKPHFHPLLAAPGTATVITFHDLSFERFPEFFSPRKKFWHTRQGPCRQAKNAEKIIAISESTKNDLMEYYKISEDRISVIYSGVNPFFGISPDQESLGKFTKEKNIFAPFLFFVGTIEPRKNISGIIRAFEMLKSEKGFFSLKLVLAGSPGWLHEEIFERIKNSPYRNDIVFLGKVSDEELRILYRLASVFVFPSFFEGFGFPPLEAQMSGTPVVSSKEGSLPEILSDSAEYVDPKNIESIAGGIKKVLEAEELRESLIKRGFENVKRFSWEETARRTIETIKDSV